MTIEKMDLKTPDITDENVKRIAQIFPNVVTEGKDADGKLVRVVDFDALRQELSDSIVEGPQERYRLDWPGKRAAMLAANTPITKTLRPCREESVDFDTTKNLFIEGDNLDALKLLQETYLGKVKMIYIDPPYNTGKDFIYKDNFTQGKTEYMEGSGQVDEDGGRLVANPDSNGRYHSDWLSMMYPRLKLARNLLRDDGVIFISIDSNEIQNLLLLSDTVFGQKNYLTSLIWRSGRTAASHFTTEHEYVVAFAKSVEAMPFFNFVGDANISDRAIKKPGTKNPVSDISFSAGIDFECEDIVFPSRFGDKEPVEVISGVLECKDGKLANDVVLRAAWTMKDMIEDWQKGLQVIDQKGQIVSRFFFKSNGVLQYEKIKGTIHPKTIIEKISTKQGSSEQVELFGNNYFDYPKPKAFMRYFIDPVFAGTEKQLVLDFFAGSSTSADAVLSSNAKLMLNTKFIMVQIPESTNEKSEARKEGYTTIADLSKERIRRAGKKILADNPDQVGKLDVGFRVLKIDSSNMNDVYYAPHELDQKNLLDTVEHIKPDRSAEDLLFQVMLDWGVDLSLPIVREKLAGKTVYTVGDNVLMACFDMKISDDVVKEMAKRKPLRAVFRDDGFDDSYKGSNYRTADAMKINTEQLFKQMTDGHTDVRVV